MSTPLDREFLQTKAKQCRYLAETVRDPDIRQRLQAIALDYDTMAINRRNKQQGGTVQKLYWHKFSPFKERDASPERQLR